MFLVGFSGHGIAIRHILVATAATLALSGACLAQDSPLPFGQNIAQPPIKCTCRYKGQDYHLGEVVCLSTSAGPRIAQCEMALNNTSWTITPGPCPTASAPTPGASVFAAADPVSK